MGDGTWGGAGLSLLGASVEYTHGLSPSSKPQVHTSFVALGSHLESPGWTDGAEFGATDNKVWLVSGWTLQ